MIDTTLAYLEKENQWLMLLRNKKKEDINEGKWIGVGGKVEEGETPLQCIQREILEETGYICEKPQLVGILYFYYQSHVDERIFVYWSNQFHGQLIENNEGTMKWIAKDRILDLNLWEGDRFFLEKMLKKEGETFCYSLKYDEHGKLIEIKDHGKIKQEDLYE